MNDLKDLLHARLFLLDMDGTLYLGDDVFPGAVDFIHTLAEHNYQNRTIALVEGGSWMPKAAKVMKKQLADFSDITFTEAGVTVLGALNDDSRARIAALADELSA